MKRPQWKSTRVVCHLKLQKSKKWKHVAKVYDGITYDECQYSVCVWGPTFCQFHDLSFSVELTAFGESARLNEIHDFVWISSMYFHLQRFFWLFFSNIYDYTDFLIHCLPHRVNWEKSSKNCECMSCDLLYSLLTDHWWLMPNLLNITTRKHFQLPAV